MLAIYGQELRNMLTSETLRTKPIPRSSKPGWYGNYARAKAKACTIQENVVIAGGSIVHHLQRYPVAWEKLNTEETKVINCGSHGDRIQNVLNRVENLYLPDKTPVGIIQCGINDIRGGLILTFQHTGLPLLGLSRVGRS